MGAIRQTAECASSPRGEIKSPGFAAVPTPL